MSFFKRLFGRKQPLTDPAVSAPAKEQPAKQAPVQPDPSELIKFYDSYGRELYITRQEWRDKVLRDNLEKAKNDPDRLYDLIVSALDDGFAADVVKYAEILQIIDPHADRGAVTLGVVYLKVGRLNDAERTLTSYLKLHGEDGYILTNLAKVYAERGQQEKADATLWHALELDPNQHNALNWYWALEKERNGEAAGTAALERISHIPTSWRAQLWLARAALERKDKAQALDIYAAVLQSAPKPLPVDLLMQLSGDLGMHGHMVELLKLTLPHFDAAAHGLLVGNNLIKANVELGRLDHAQAILDQLYAQKRPDYQETLSYWDTEIAKARVQQHNTEPVPQPSMGIVAFAGPIWLAQDSPAKKHLNADKAADAVAVVCLGSTTENPKVKRSEAQMPNAAGRLSRAVPLFLAEQIHLRTDAAGIVYQPWVSGRGFLVVGGPWEPDVVMEQAQKSNPPADYAVVTHIIDAIQIREVEYRLFRCIDGTMLDQGRVPLNAESPEASFVELSDRVLKILCQQAQVDPVHKSPHYELPHGDAFSSYQLRLEQLLAIRAGDSEDTSGTFLSGLREIIRGNLFLCLNQPQNATVRLLLAETLRRLNNSHQSAVAEFRDQIQQLQKQHPLNEPMQSLVQDVLDEAYQK